MPRELTVAGGQIRVTRDDHDWLLELGRQHGDSRIIGAQHATAQGLVKQFRAPLADGLSLPWADDASDRVRLSDKVRFMPRKVTVWSGPTFAGKTQFLRQLMLHALANRHKALFVSLEEQPEDVWREFVTMATLTRS